jgi:hypothetical protein
MAIKVRGNFLGATIVAVIYTIFILMNVSTMGKAILVISLVILNALTIILMYFAFK